MDVSTFSEQANRDPNNEVCGNSLSQHLTTVSVNYMSKDRSRVCRREPISPPAVACHLTVCSSTA